MTLRTWLVCCFYVAISVISGPARAQAPALYWTHFDMGAPQHCGGVNWCPSVALSTLSNEHFNPKKDGTVGVFGSNNDTSVVVHCTPVGSGRVSAGVFATSTNAQTAEQVRNKIKQGMQGAGCL
jgi:hypothetical protein